MISPQGALEGKIGDLFLRKIIPPVNYYQKIRANLSEMVSDSLAPSYYLLDKHIEYGFFCQAKKNVTPNSHGYTLNQIREHRLTIIPKNSQFAKPCL